MQPRAALCWQTGGHRLRGRSPTNSGRFHDNIPNDDFDAAARTLCNLIAPLMISHPFCHERLVAFLQRNGDAIISTEDAFYSFRFDRIWPQVPTTCMALVRDSTDHMVSIMLFVRHNHLLMINMSVIA